MGPWFYHMLGWLVLSDPPARATTLEQLTRRIPRQADEARAYVLAPGVWTLTLPLVYPRPRSVNAYLLELDDGVCLVDCGSCVEPGWTALVHALGQAGRAPDDIRLLVCTHLHQDHAGLAATVASEVGCPLARPRGPQTAHDGLRDSAIDLVARRERATREGVPPDQLPLLVGSVIAADGFHDRARFDRTLDARDTITGPCGTWEIVPIPGHSPAQLGLFDRKRRWLMSADLVFEDDVPFLEFGAAPDPLSDHLQSLARVLDLEPRRLLPGHGRPVEPEAKVRERLHAARTSTLALRDIARQAVHGDQRTAYEVSLLLDEGNRDLDWRQSALSIALCALEHLVLRGEATERLGRDGVRRFRGSNAASHP